MEGAGMDAAGAATTAGAVGARVKRALPQSRSWAWGQRQLTRIAELRSQAEVMRVRANGETRLAWALVFGDAQQLFTRMVDERGQAVLAAVGGPENPDKA
jgi:hypothetical protein